MKILGVQYSHQELVALVVSFVFHGLCVLRLLPLPEVLNDTPLLFSDHPVHAHRVYFYRSQIYQGRAPWGYDPTLSAGSVMSPAQDVGAKPQQVFGLLLPFLRPGTVIRLFLFLVAIIFPLWVILACQRLRIPSESHLWIVLCLTAPVWLYKWITFYFYYGLVGFATASLLAPLVLAEFVGFVDRPAWRRYWIWCLVASATILFHCLGLVVLVPTMLLVTIICWPKLDGWRLALVGAPLIVAGLNAFWIVPFVLGIQMPRLPTLPIDTERHLTYSSWEQVISGVFPWKALLALAIVGLAGWGLNLMRKRLGGIVAIAFAMASLTALGLKYLGSFVPFVVVMQPSRFIVPAMSLLALPVGLAIGSLIQRMRVPSAVAGGLVAVVLTVFAAISEKPDSIPLPASQDRLFDYVLKNTSSEDRLLIQTREFYEPKIMPLYFGREVIGNTFPESGDAAQFLPVTLWGRKLADWDTRALRTALQRWGVSWVFTAHPEARNLISAATGQPGEPAGDYQAFQISSPVSRFLVGRGRIRATVNRFELTEVESEQRWIVLRYRYHPAWAANQGIRIWRYSVPEDPIGFIAIQDPPRTLRLNFDCWRMFSAKWSEDSRVPSIENS